MRAFTFVIQRTSAQTRYRTVYKVSKYTGAINIAWEVLALPYLIARRDGGGLRNLGGLLLLARRGLSRHRDVRFRLMKFCLVLLSPGSREVVERVLYGPEFLRTLRTLRILRRQALKI